MPDHILNFSKHEIYETGAQLIALLAYPEPNADLLRADLHTSLCHTIFLAYSEMDPKWEVTPQLIKPLYAMRNRSTVDKDIKKMKLRLKNRMVAARMVIAFLKEINDGKKPELPKEINRLTVNQMAVLAMEDVGQVESANIKSRIWRPSAPVIHLAAAIQVLMQIISTRDGIELNIADFILDRNAIEWVVRAAMEYEKLLAQVKRFKINPDDLLRVRLA